MLKFQVERLMVDADAGIVEFTRFQAKPSFEHLCGSLHAVAQAGDLNIRLTLQIAHQHRHRIRVIEHYRIRTQFLNIPDDGQQYRSRAEKTEDPGRSSCVADAVINPVLHGDLDIVAPHIDSALQDGDQDTVRVFESFAPVSRSLNDSVMSSGFNDPFYAPL